MRQNKARSSSACAALGAALRAKAAVAAKATKLRRVIGMIWPFMLGRDTFHQTVIPEGMTFRESDSLSRVTFHQFECQARAIVPFRAVVASPARKACMNRDFRCNQRTGPAHLRCATAWLRHAHLSRRAMSASPVAGPRVAPYLAPLASLSISTNGGNP